MKTNRVKAMAWWNVLGTYSKFFYMKTYGSEIVKNREPETLTGREIQELWESNQEFAKKKIIELIAVVTDVDYMEKISQLATDRHLLLYHEE
jgi:hypothetical protein